jgi:hypothetical protein
MLFVGPGDGEKTDAHEGYVTGRYRDGAFTDIWTDVLKCADWTFTAYAPACECGWRGDTEPATAEGYLACRRGWVRNHFQRLDAVQPILRALGRPLQDEADFLS